MAFKVLQSALQQGSAARLGSLALPNRKVIDTPHFIAISSRGTVPHVTPDILSKHATFGGAYMALEDFIEKKSPPILSAPPTLARPLHAFTGFPRDMVTIMGPRRCTPVKTPVGNGSQSLSIWTSTGASTLPIDTYAAHIEALSPDIAIAPAELFHTSVRPPAKKLVRMADRTEEWVARFLKPSRREKLRESGTAVFAPIVGVPHHVQWQYLKQLSEDEIDALVGLAIYDVKLLPAVLEHYKPLVPLARLSLHTVTSPQQILEQIAAGVDICAVPFLNTTSDAGIALDFTFPPPEGPHEHPLALGTSMWSPEHVTSVTPLAPGCQCYACTKHHRAYIHHLLNANEMLAWTLLQIHNHHVVGEFFAGIRAAFAAGPTRFEELSEQFVATYEAEIPLGSGSRPRARGYHFKGIANQPKINESKWANLNDGGEGAEDAVRPSDATSESARAARSATETPVVPDESSVELDKKGFASKEEGGALAN
ncbi:tRNA-guanine transglycosylase family protein [Verticillium dahliae]|nr:Regulatory protein MIG1 [Verticillium dahliae VDG2]KAH6690909.1 tRNA-guanine transglycosylase family protein [Verticillium dahliae]